jgi:phenylacetate-coenzyme A ligase PaaK-like adenylate-forming protein
MSLLNGPMRFYFSRIAKRFEASLFDPRPAQEQALRNLVGRLGGSPLSYRLGLTQVTSLEGARKLPVTDYSTIEIEVQMMRNFGRGADGIFGRSPLLAIALTSGTTGEPKRLPLTRDYLKSYRRFTLAMNACYFATTNAWDSMTGGKSLLLTARPNVSVSEGGLTECFISGFMATQVPRWYRRKILPSQELLYLPTWDEKMDAILDEARPQRVRSIGAVPALAISLTERALARYHAKNLREIWPELRGLLFSGTALSPTMAERFKTLWGATASDPLIFWSMYASTEAQIGHSFDPTWAADRMVFNPFENFYQFLEEGRGKPVFLHELEKGKRYVILFTAPGGLINYRNGDWIEVLSTKPLTFRVAGRDKEEISIASEKINAVQIDQAVARASEKSRVPVEYYVMYPVEGAPSRLVCAVPDQVASSAAIARQLDIELGEINSAYRELRINNMVYGPLELKPLPDSVFRDYREKNMDRGQFKPKQMFRSEQAFRKEYGL